MDPQARVKRFGDASVPLEQREQEIRDLGRRDDNDAVQLLIAAAESDLYLNRAAMEALGGSRRPEASEFLKRQLVASHKQPNVALLLENIRSTTRALGQDAVAPICGVLRDNRLRDDGHAPAIATACVRALADLGLREAVPTLAEELDGLLGNEQRSLDLAYGGEIVNAIETIRDPGSHQVLIAYADQLARRLPEDPEPKGFCEAKIREARRAAESIMR